MVVVLLGAALTPLSSPRLRRLRHCLLPVADRDPAEVTVIARAARRGPLPDDPVARTVALHRAEEVLDQLGGRRAGVVLQLLTQTAVLASILVNARGTWWVRRRQARRVTELRSALSAPVPP